MNCHKVCHLLSAYMDGELPGIEHRQVNHHVFQCDECREEYEDLLQMKRMLAGMRTHDAGPTLATVILQRVDEAESRQPINKVRLLLSTMKRMSGSAIAPPMIGLGFGLTAFVILHANQTPVSYQNDGVSQKVIWSPAGASQDTSFRDFGVSTMQTPQPNRFMVQPMGNVTYSLTYKDRNNGMQPMSSGYINHNFDPPSISAGVQWFRVR